MKLHLMQYRTFAIISLGILAIFVIRTALAVHGNLPMLNDLFTLITLASSLAVLIVGVRCLYKRDWVIALILGAVVGVSMPFATLFTPYPFFGIVRDNLGQAFVRGFCVTLAALGGLVIMRQGGPVKILAANDEWKKSGLGILFGLAIGLPLAVMNVFALRLTQGQEIVWQNPLAALLDALQPGIVEEVVYRFALWGLLWLVLRKTLPGPSIALAGLLATLVHSYQHFDVLFVQSPVAALGMGLVMSLIWGLPPFFLARHRGLESAIVFHWIQDMARFIAGF
jgi:hypothetical protein